MTQYDYIILGAGAAGLQVAWTMSHDPFFQNKKILLIDKVIKEGNDRTWCFWEKGKGNWDDILEASWKTAVFKSIDFHKKFDLKEHTYKMLKSGKFYGYVLDRLSAKKNFTIIQGSVLSQTKYADGYKVNTSIGEFIGRVVLSSILDENVMKESQRDLWLAQHFKGWYIKTDRPSFNSSEVIMMDFDIPQGANTRFMYVLPVNETEALVEYTLFSKDILADAEYDKAIEVYLESLDISNYQIEETEFGVIPMTTFPFDKRNDDRLVFIGTAGGWTKASTGYTFYNSGKMAKKLCDYLKKGRSLKNFSADTRFAFYDKVMLDMLCRKNELGSEFFTSVYRHQNISSILDFLHEESSILEEIKIVLQSSPRVELLRSVRNVVF